MHVYQPYASEMSTNDSINHLVEVIRKINLNATHFSLLGHNVMLEKALCVEKFSRVSHVTCTY
jgi:hypothetical protein